MITATLLSVLTFSFSAPVDEEGKRTVTDPFAEPGEEPAPSPAPAPAPAPTNTAPAAAPAPAPEGPQPQPSNPKLDVELERRNEMRGAGTALAITSAVSMGSAIGLQIAFARTTRRCYEGVFDENPNQLSELELLGECERQSNGLRWGARVLQPTTMVLAMVGGSLLGKGYAYTDASLGRKAQSAGGYAAGGGALLGIGFLAYVTTRIVFLRDDWKNRCSHAGYIECARYNQGVIDGTADAAFVAMAYGGMMLTYGSSYGKTSRRLNATLLPEVSRGYAGLSLTKRF